MLEDVGYSLTKDTFKVYFESRKSRKKGNKNMEIDIPKLECKRCGWKWWPRKKDVRLCPKCKSARWEQSRTKTKAKERGK
ncbi:MAG: hypothetical protein GY858_08940 [Candidatus Omnitrophica bacterium]|nr:hypothetical protein [Candidatus Omnitrophota bacterium]